MNKSYRSIWNEALGAWVAASEVTKARGKRGRSAVISLAVVGGGLLVSPHLLAQYNGTTQNVGNTSGNASIAIGSNTGTGKANAAAG